MFFGQSNILLEVIKDHDLLTRLIELSIKMLSQKWPCEWLDHRCRNIWCLEKRGVYNSGGGEGVGRGWGGVC